MSKNPLNLTLRFLLELAGLFALAYWGWTQHTGWLRILLTIGLPVLAAAVWGIFRVPNDPGKAPVVVPGYLRLGIEVLYFSAATWALKNAGQPTWAWVLGVLVVIHYLLSFDRLNWMLGQPNAKVDR